MAHTMKKEVSNDYLHEDITFAIISKLPIKSIKRFSCACKSWCSLFENQHFMTMFQKNLLSKTHPLYNDAYLILNHFAKPFHSDLYVLSGDRLENKVQLEMPALLPLENGNEHIRILGSTIDGTICLYDYIGHTSVALWNIDTDEVNAIPPSYGLIRPNSTEYRFHGFGYDDVRDDYKVIQHVDSYTFNNNVHVNECFWNIYSLNSNTWRRMNSDMPRRYQDWETEVYLKGMSHWWGGTHYEACMVSFNWSNEEYYITPSPIEDLPGCLDINLVVLNGMLGLVYNYKEHTSFQISILAELGVKESWIKLHNVEPLCGISCIAAWKNGNIFFVKENGELTLLDLTTGVTYEIGFKEQNFRSQIVIFD